MCGLAVGNRVKIWTFCDDRLLVPGRLLPSCEALAGRFDRRIRDPRASKGPELWIALKVAG